VLRLVSVGERTPARLPSGAIWAGAWVAGGALIAAAVAFLWVLNEAFRLALG
jgi:hypothetical protein